MVCFRYIIVNTLHTGDNKDDDDDDDDGINNNNNSVSETTLRLPSLQSPFKLLDKPPGYELLAKM
jgi:hypothetical protein